MLPACEGSCENSYHTVTGENQDLWFWKPWVSISYDTDPNITIVMGIEINGAGRSTFQRIDVSTVNILIP